jgi:hypothetical protein
MKDGAPGIRLTYIETAEVAMLIREQVVIAKRAFL